MHLATIATVLFLPFVAVAQEPSSTTTCTSYVTLTQTITLQKAAIATVVSNSTSLLSSPTPTVPTPASTTALPSTSPTNAGSALSAANVAFAAIAGVAVAAFL